MNKIFTWIGIILVVAGAIVSVFAGVSQAEIIGIATAMVGAGVLCTNIVKKAKSENKNMVLVYISMGLIAVGAFLTSLLGMHENTVTQIIVTAIGLVTLIVGLVTANKLKS